MTVAVLCKSIFVGDFTDIKKVGENKNPFVNFDLKYEVSVGKSKSPPSKHYCVVCLPK